MSDASRHNREFYDAFWRACGDFTRYNPGARHRRRIILETLEGLSFSSLLDVGCGEAELLAAIRARFPSAALCGADLSSTSADALAARLPGVRGFVLNVEKEALPERFDVVVCSEVVEHLQHRDEATGHLAAMVRPGGHLLLTCPTGRMYPTERHFGHVSHPTEGEMRALAERHGLDVVRAWNWGWPLYRAMKWATNVNPGFALRNFGTASYTPLQRHVSTALYWVNHLNRSSSGHGCQLVLLLRRRGA